MAAAAGPRHRGRRAHGIRRTCRRGDDVRRRARRGRRLATGRRRCRSANSPHACRTAPAPPDCAITAGRTWTELTGTAHVDIGAPAPVIDLTVRACVGIDQPSVLITSTANLNSWRPVPSQDFTFNSVGLAIRKPSGGDWTIDVVGTANYAGITLAGRARFAPTTGSFVLDAAGDLSGLHLGPVSSGHVVFTNNPVNNYVPVPLPSDPPSGAAPINLVTGVTAFADINLDAGTRAALDKVLNPPAPQPKVLPIPESIRFAAQLGGASLRLKASISFPPGQGLTLFATCPDEAPKVGGQCVLSHKLTTSLRLTTFFLSIDTTGRFGFGGEADLQLAVERRGRATRRATARDRGGQRRRHRSVDRPRAVLHRRLGERARDQRPDASRSRHPGRCELRLADPDPDDRVRRDRRPAPRPGGRGAGHPERSTRTDAVRRQHLADQADLRADARAARRPHVPEARAAALGRPRQRAHDRLREPRVRAARWRRRAVPLRAGHLDRVRRHGDGNQRQRLGPDHARPAEPARRPRRRRDRVRHRFRTRPASRAPTCCST